MAAAKKGPNKHQLPLLSQAEIEGPKGLVALTELAQRVGKCTQCGLHEKRSRVVMGEGPWNKPRLMIVGEAPGRDEDETGRPFQGRSGSLLNSMLRRMGLDRSNEVFITNTVLCRPPGNRVPQADELAACAANLHTQIEAVQPQVILAMGKTAAKALVTTDQHMRWMRSRWHEWRGRKVRVTWHPAYILRKVSEGEGDQAKQEAWSDLTEVLIELGMEVPSGPGTPAPSDRPQPAQPTGVEPPLPEGVFRSLPVGDGPAGGDPPGGDDWLQ